MRNVHRSGGLRIRPLRTGESGAVREFCARLSPDTRYRRFFSAAAVPDSVLRLLTSTDDRERIALVAERDAERGAEIVGIGNFAAVDGSIGEMAVVVRDDCQRQRVGSELASRVMQAAEGRGFQRFIVHVLAENVAVRRLLAKLGEPVSTAASGGVFEVMLVRRSQPGKLPEPVATDSPRGVARDEHGCAGRPSCRGRR
ncbi:MAG: N-acetyltransferase family protein [Betaproteobacteria bacterium]